MIVTGGDRLAPDEFAEMHSGCKANPVIPNPVVSSAPRHERKLLYAAWRVSGSPVSIRDLYRTRFGVVSSYRQLGQACPRTSTTDGVIRLLWVAVGLILRNAWVRFRSERERTLGAACVVLLAEVLTAQAHPATRGDVKTPNDHARPPT